MSRESHDGYLIEDAPEPVLQNRWGITDPDALAAMEREATVLAAMELVDHPVTRSFDREHLCTLHQRLFGDVYQWAGHMRDNQITLDDGARIEPIDRLEKAGTVFASASEIDRRLKALQNPIDNALALEDPDEFAREASYILGEINAIHPFREGNGRVQRLFLQEMAEEAGHEMDFSVIDAPRNIEASEAAMHGSMGPLLAMVRDTVLPDRRILLHRTEDYLRTAGQWAMDAELSRRTLDDEETVDGVLLALDEVAILATDHNEIIAAWPDRVSGPVGPDGTARLAGVDAARIPTGPEI